MKIEHVYEFLNKVQDGLKEVNDAINGLKELIASEDASHEPLESQFGEDPIVKQTREAAIEHEKQQNTPIEEDISEDEIMVEEDDMSAQIPLPELEENESVKPLGNIVEKDNLKDPFNGM